MFIFLGSDSYWRGGCSDQIGGKCSKQLKTLNEITIFKVHIEEFTENIKNWFTMDLNNLLKLIHELHKKELDKLVRKVENMHLKDSTAMGWLPVRRRRLKETVISIFDRIQKRVKEFDELLQNESSEMKETYNLVQFRLYFMTHNWNYYGLSKYFYPERMKQIFDPKLNRSSFDIDFKN